MFSLCMFAYVSVVYVFAFESQYVVITESIWRSDCGLAMDLETPAGNHIGNMSINIFLFSPFSSFPTPCIHFYDSAIWLTIQLIFFYHGMGALPDTKTSNIFSMSI